MLMEKKPRYNEEHEIKLRPCKDGTIEIVGGKIEVVPPRGTGKWPVICPGLHMQVFYEGTKVKGPTVIFDKNLLEIKLINELPKSDFEIIVSADKTQVVLKTRFQAGKKYRLADSKPTQRLVLERKIVGSIEPQAIESKDVYQKLQNMGIKVPILHDQLMAACTSLQNGETIVAQGKPIIPPEDGIIEYICSFQERLLDEDALCKERIDYYDRGLVNSVEAGSVLAYWTPPVLGKAGSSVFGEVIKPPEPKNKSLPVGKGVQLINAGRIAVATVDGRPFLSGRDNTLSVVTQLVINKDVDLSTGHIDFKGDVLIMGDVTEGLHVRANGNVEVKGNVFHAQVASGGNVIIHEKVVGGHIQAGGKQTLLMQLNDTLTSLNPLLDKLLHAYRRVVGSIGQKQPKNLITDESCLLNQIAENQAPGIKKCLQSMKELKALLPLDDRLTKELGSLKFSLESHSQATELFHACLQLQEEIQHQLKFKADVLLNYCQNALIEATGDIVVSGPLAYNSHLYCGGQIKINGDCRGGILTAATKISAGVLGADAGVKTVARVNEGGVILADQFCPNAWIQIGNARHQIQEACYKLQFRFDGDKWQRYSLY